MNYKGFKKVSSDDKSTTLKHPAGHELKIAHSALTEKLKAELDKLPSVKKMADGGPVRMYAQGAAVDSGDDSSDQSDSGQAPVVVNVGTPTPVQAPAPSMAQRAGTALRSLVYNPATSSVAPQPMDNSTNQHIVGAAKDFMRGASGNAAPAAPQGPAPAAIAPPTYEQDPNQNTDTPSIAPQQPSNDDQDNEDNSQSPQAPAPTAPAMQAPAPAQNQGQGPTNAAVANPDQQSDQYKKSFNDYMQDHQQNLAQEDAAWAQDLKNGHVTSENYHDLFNKRSTLGKVGMLFGMLMSGAGSGLSHQSNALLESMNNEIKNDIDAQKTSKTNAQNFIRLGQQQKLNEANIAQTGAQTRGLNVQNAVNSDALARMRANRVALQEQINKVKNMSTNDPQYPAAEKALAMMGQGVDATNYSLGQAAAAKSAFFDMMGGQNNGQGSEQQFQNQENWMRMTGNDKLADDKESKHFPGIQGQASVSISPADRDKLNSGITFQNQLGRFIDWTKNHSGDLNPSDIAEGKALSNGLSSAYRDAIGGGVYKSSEQDFIGQSVDPDPTKFFNKVRVLPKLNAVQRDAAAQLDQKAKSLGFRGYGGAPAQPQPSQSSQAQTKTVNGITYKRGPNGEAIKVN